MKRMAPIQVDGTNPSDETAGCSGAICDSVVDVRASIGRRLSTAGSDAGAGATLLSVFRSRPRRLDVICAADICCIAASPLEAFQSVSSTARICSRARSRLSASLPGVVVRLLIQRKFRLKVPKTAAALPHRSTRAESLVTILKSGVSSFGAEYSGGYTRKAPNSGLPFAMERSGSTTIASHGLPLRSSRRCQASCVDTSIADMKQWLCFSTSNGCE
eukprot:scaffold377_cov269-Pinguiococcus_pyrenoidosus.AAC.12